MHIMPAKLDDINKDLIKVIDIFCGACEFRDGRLYVIDVIDPLVNPLFIIKYFINNQFSYNANYPATIVTDGEKYRRIYNRARNEYALFVERDSRASLLIPSRQQVCKIISNLVNESISCNYLLTI